METKLLGGTEKAVLAFCGLAVMTMSSLMYYTVILHPDESQLQKEADATISYVTSHDCTFEKSKKPNDSAYLCQGAANGPERLTPEKLESQALKEAGLPPAKN